MLTPNQRRVLIRLLDRGIPEGRYFGWADAFEGSSLIPEVQHRRGQILKGMARRGLVRRRSGSVWELLPGAYAALAGKAVAA